MDAASLLLEEVARFRQWAAKIPLETRSGEWECDYPDWQSVWAAAKHLIETVPTVNWTTALKDNFLYAVARDNETGNIADQLLGRSDALLVLAAQAIHSVEIDAKWQMAARLGELHEYKREAEALLVQFVQDGDEYVRRRALLALGRLGSAMTESFADTAWQTGHEYQRIAALWALKDAASSKLRDYLQRAHEDGRKYLVGNAMKIRAASDFSAKDS